jgi:hypothetical protein
LKHWDETTLFTVRPYLKEMKMALYVKVTALGLMDSLKKAGRGNSFSREACKLLVDYYAELKGMQELDVVDICCSWAEVDMAEVLRLFPVDAEEHDDVEAEAMRLLRQRTLVLGETNRGVVYLVF